MKNSTKRIDVIVPVYNTAPRLLERCLSSILSQSYKNVMIIVVDDGSTNNKTIDVLKDFENKKNVSIIKQSNSGVSSARNTGLKKSTGEYIYFVDSDDYIDIRQLENLLLCAENKKYDAVFAGREKIGVKNYKMPFANHEINLKNDAKRILMMSHMFVNTGVLIKGDVARSINFNESIVTMGEDTEYAIEILLRGRCFYSGCGGYYYTSNENSITHDVSTQGVKRYLDESIIQVNFFKKRLSICDENAMIFMYLKALRAYQRLRGKCAYNMLTGIVKAYIDKNIKGKPNKKTLHNNDYLSKSEKIKIYLLSHRHFVILYCAVTTTQLAKKVSHEKR